MKEKIVMKSIWFDDNKPHLDQPINVKTGIVLVGDDYDVIVDNYNRIKHDFPYLVERERGYITNNNRFVSELESSKIRFMSGELV
jgi:hypothetical protein